MGEPLALGTPFLRGDATLAGDTDTEGLANGFRSALVEAADPMLLLDDERRLVDANRAACTLFGLTRESVTTRALDELVLDETAHLDVAWRELLALGEATHEHRVRTTDGVERLVEGSYRARVEPHRHLCIARDITERRLLEERLVQFEKMESVGRLAGGIAHDFNNLLTAILGYTDLLLSGRGPNDPDRTDLEEIQKAGQRAAALTQQLLAFSRKQVLLPREVDLNETVVKLEGMLRRLIREDITLVCELSPEPAVVRVDPAQFEQVIVNLVLNARDALPSAGTIRLDVARLPSSEVEIPRDQPTRAAEYVRLRVIDDGVGITPEVRARLFEPFFTTKDIGKGTGLGLASAYGIVRQSHGSIGVASSPGRGATFTVHLPLAAEAPLPARPPKARSRPTGGDETILLVEDEDAVRRVVSTVLRRHGYRVLDAATPGEACDLFERHASDVDLLLTDIIMPDMSGPALAQRLVALHPALRVLFMSGYSDSPFPFDGDTPNISFLGKPFQVPALAAKVREVLSRLRTGAQPETKE